MRQLTIGIHTFERIIDEQRIYIDKTKHIHRLITTGATYFLSRPRRFGKSLLVSTLQAIFEGKRNLFEGLWIAEQTDYSFETFPVFQLDMSNPKVYHKNDIEDYVIYMTNMTAEKYNLTLTQNSYEMRVSELIRKLSAINPVVILIDEYDKPLLDHLTSPQRDEVKEALKGLYTAIKASDAYLRFVLLTGVTKFSKISVFSGLNNLIDISMDNYYADMLGITQAELEGYFPDYIQALAQANGERYEATLEKIKFWYNGYRFSARESYVYNPFSTLLLLAQQDFKFHWFETGTPTFLLELIKNRPSSWRQISEDKWASAEEFSTYEVEHLNPLPLLFQTGYLTIQEIDDRFAIRMYRLDYPNFEVRQAFLGELLKHFSQTQQQTSHIYWITHYFQQGDIDAVLEELKIFFAHIEYDLHLKYEKYYQTIFFAIFQLLGFNIKTEVKTNQGRIDAVVELPDTIYLFEFKLFDTAAMALQQIKTGKYFQKYKIAGKTIFMVGVAFDTTDKNISDWLVEKR